MTPFARTLTYVDAIEARGSRPFVVLVLAACCSFGAWLGAGSTKLYAASNDGSLLAAGAATPVQSPLAGVVRENHLVLGARVRAGDPLVVLESRSQEIARDAENEHAKNLDETIGLLDELLAAETRLAEATSVAGARRVGSAVARQRAAADVMALTKQEQALLDRAHASGVTTGIDALRAAEALQRDRSQFAIQSADSAAAAAESERLEREANVRLLTMQREIADLRSTRSASTARVAELEWEIAQRTLRAPVDATVADVVGAPPGAAVAANVSLGTLVPDAPMKWVAYFPANEVVGRLQPGQHARIRLDAFPWTAYGFLEATVASVGSEPREQRVRVELDLVPGATVPLSHGMTGATDVEVETLPPYRLALRMLGKSMGTGR